VNAMKISQTVCSYRFVQTFVVEYEFLVLLPGSDKIVGNSVEHLAIDLGLGGGGRKYISDFRHQI